MKIVLLNNSRSPNYANKVAKAIREITSHKSYQIPIDSIEVVDNRTAAESLKKGKKFTEGKDAVISLGSDFTWKTSGTKEVKTQSGKKKLNYVKREDAAHKHLYESEIPVYAICGGAQALAQYYGVRVTNAGKHHGGKYKGKHGNYVVNHKYYMAKHEVPDTLDVKATVVSKHTGEEMAYHLEDKVKNKVMVQIHPEKTPDEAWHIGDFLKGIYQRKYQGQNNYGNQKNY